MHSLVLIVEETETGKGQCFCSFFNAKFLPYLIIFQSGALRENNEINALFELHSTEYFFSQGTAVFSGSRLFTNLIGS